MKNLHVNLQALYDGNIIQRQTSMDERIFYFNWQLIRSDPDKYEQELVYDDTT